MHRREMRSYSIMAIKWQNSEYEFIDFKYDKRKMIVAEWYSGFVAIIH